MLLSMSCSTRERDGPTDNAYGSQRDGQYTRKQYQNYTRCQIERRNEGSGVATYCRPGRFYEP